MHHEQHRQRCLFHLLSDNNIFSGNNTFTKVISLQNATSSLTTLSTTWFSGLTSSLLSTNENGHVVATTSIGMNFLAGTLGVGQGGTGSTTLGGILKGNGAGYIQSAIAGTDYPHRQRCLGQLREVGPQQHAC